jgi:hypothetical protein
MEVEELQLELRLQLQMQSTLLLLTALETLHGMNLIFLELIG